MIFISQLLVLVRKNISNILLSASIAENKICCIFFTVTEQNGNTALQNIYLSIIDIHEVLFKKCSMYIN